MQSRCAASATRRQRHREHRAAPDAAAQRQRRIAASWAMRSAIARPSPSPCPDAPSPRRNSSKIACCWSGAMPGAGVVHLDAQRVADRGARRAARVRVRCSAPRWRGSSAARGAAVAGRCAPRRASARNAKAQAALGGERAELRRQRLQHFGQRELARLRHQSAGFQPRHVEQAGQQVGGGIERAADLQHRVALALVAQLLRQRIGEQVRGVQRLQQVVADRGEEAALGIVGALGLALGGFQRRRCARPTRCSSVSLACSSAASARRNAVTSVKVATKPPPGIGLPRISTMLPSGNTRSDRCGVPARM